MINQKSKILKERQSISNIRNTYEISPYIKQLKTFEERLRIPRSRTKTNDLIRPKQNDFRQSLLKHTQKLLKEGGASVDWCNFENKENKFYEFGCQEFEEKSKQKMLMEKIRNIRAQSRDNGQITQASTRDESFISHIGSNHSQIVKVRQNSKSSMGCFGEVDHEERVSFFKYKMSKRFM